MFHHLLVNQIILMFFHQRICSVWSVLLEVKASFLRRLRNEGLNRFPTLIALFLRALLLLLIQSHWFLNTRKMKNCRILRNMLHRSKMQFLLWNLRCTCICRGSMQLEKRTCFGGYSSGSNDETAYRAV